MKKLQDISKKIFKKAWFDPERTIFQEKILGPADTSISQIIIEEAQLYGSGSRDLNTTVSNIKRRSDEAIKEAAVE